ncbi:MAG: hypothetical protein ACKVE4_02720 [Dissulfuribacterales bacterium]
MIYQHPIKSTIIKILIAAITICLFFIQPCFADQAEKTKEVSVIGGSRIYTDILSARSAAVSECLFTAVESTAIEILPFSSLTVNFEVISGILTTQRSKFIRDYKVLKEFNTDKDYRVLVQVTVSVDKLSEALAGAGIMISSENLPKILFLLAQQHVDDLSMQYWWQKGRPLFQEKSVAESLGQLFENKGFPIIDHTMIAKNFFDNLNLTGKLSDMEAVQLGKLLNADLVIAGTAIASETANRMGEDVKSFNGTVTVRAILTDTGEQIASARNVATSVSTDSSTGSIYALSDASYRAGSELISQILSKWHELQERSGELTIAIKGTDILANLVTFRNSLKNIEGITGQRTLEMTANEAVLAISYQGTTQKLADALLLKIFDDFGINIYKISESRLNIEFVKD